MWPEFVAVIQKAGSGAALEDLPLHRARAAMDAALIRWAGTDLPECAVTCLVAPGEGGDIRIELYDAASRPASRPLIVVFHGGGFVLGSLAMQHPMARLIAGHTGALVASVDYRLAPEHPWPAAPADALAAYHWLHEHAGELGADRQRMGVWGESAGATLAAVCAVGARDLGIGSKAQFLACPLTCAALDTDSWRRYATGYWLTRDTAAWFWASYLGPTAACSRPTAEPLHAQDLAGLPSTLLVTGGLDPLRDEGEAYAERLRRAGVPVVAERVDGAIHGFLSMPALSGRAAELLAGYCRWFMAALCDEPLPALGVPA